jgi:hypothetical protein
MTQYDEQCVDPFRSSVSKPSLFFMLSRLSPMGATVENYRNSSSSALASIRSGMSKPSVNPAENWREQFARFIPSILVAPQPGKTRRGTQFERTAAPRHRAEFFGPSPAIPKPSIDGFGTSEETIVTAVPFRDVDGAVIANRRM